MNRISKSELLSVLLNTKGSQFIAMEAETKPKLRAGNPFSNLCKKSRITGLINFIYENSVNNQLTREGKDANFEAKSRKWGSKIHGTSIICHNDRYYVEVKVEKEIVEYISDGLIIPLDKIEPYMYNKTSRQGTDNQIILRDYSVDSIKSICFNGNKYQIS